MFQHKLLPLRRAAAAQYFIISPAVVDDGADGAAEAGAAGALSGTGGAGSAVTLGARCPGPLALLTYTAA